MILVHKIALDVNREQDTHLRRACGVARFAYNWALAEWKRQYEAWKLDNSLPKPSWMALNKQFNAMKNSDPDREWITEVTKCAPQQAIMQLGEAFNGFFAKRTKYPKFRKKGKSVERFSLDNISFKVANKRIQIPRLGWVRMREALRFRGKIVRATVLLHAGVWFVSIAVELADTSHLKPAKNHGTIGVDLGVSALATLSDGEVIEGPKAHKHALDRLRRLSRAHSRKKKGSSNRSKAALSLARAHARIASIRSDALHKLTSDLTSSFDTIVIEDLNVSGMVKNRNLARSVSDMGFGEFRRQLEYKAAMRGCRLVIADRFFPSSKLCSDCGHRLDELALSMRFWTCPACGSRHHRDVNAAINLKNLAASSAVTACGEEGTGSRRKMRAKPASVKQEANIVQDHV